MGAQGVIKYGWEGSQVDTACKGHEARLRYRQKSYGVCCHLEIPPIWGDRRSSHSSPHGAKRKAKRLQALREAAFSPSQHCCMRAFASAHHDKPLMQ